MAGRALVEDGYARLPLDRRQTILIESLLAAGRKFFAAPMETKVRHSSTDLNFGYRPFGHEYSQTPDRPDLNECFALWSNRSDLVPNHTGVADLLTATLKWRDSLSVLVNEILVWLAAHFGTVDRIRFDNSSYVQINSYSEYSADREFLQDLHEDGHLVTLISTAGPGLEILPHRHGIEIDTGASEVLVIPGSVLTMLTGGSIAPLRHRVRNLRKTGRMSVMYFVNPELNDPLHAWVGDPGPEREDMRDLVRSGPLAFGLPPTPHLPQRMPGEPPSRRSHSSKEL